MKYNINDIKKSIKESNNKIFWYDTLSKNLISGEKKIETKKNIEKLKLKEGTHLFRLSIEFHSGTKPGQGGKISIVIKTYIIENKIIKFDNTWKEQSNGIIWFDDKFLEERGWKNYYLTNIINKLNNNKLKLNFGIILYKKIE